jgi:hypothetical protein
VPGLLSALENNEDTDNQHDRDSREEKARGYVRNPMTVAQAELRNV